MVADGIIYVTAPLKFAFDDDGNMLLTIISHSRTFTFAMSRHKSRSANVACRGLLDAADTAQTDRVRTFKGIKG